MKVHHIKIRNILGIEAMDIEPGQVTEITGRNGAGKSSIVAAIQTAIGGGTDASLIRKGAAEGEVVLMLDDGVEIRKRLAGGRHAVSVKHPELGSVGAGQTYIDRLHDALGLNPVELLTAPPAKRGQYLLEAMPLSVTDEQLLEAIADIEPVAVDWQGYEHRHALETIAYVRRQVYDARTGANRIAKEKATTAAQLGESIAGIDEDVTALQAELSGTLASIEQQQAAERSAVDAARERRSQKLAAIAAWKEEQLAKLNAAVEAKRLSVQGEYESSIEDAKVCVEPERETAAALRQRIDAATRSKAARDTRDLMQAEANEARREADALTAALDRLDALKARLISDSPLGVEIGEDGEIYRDGIPFSRLNKAAQVEIAMRLAILRAGKLPLVCVDGLEVLDSEAYDAFLAAASRESVQLIVTRVADHDLQVESRAAA